MEKDSYIRQTEEPDWNEFAIGFWQGFSLTLPFVLIFVGIYFVVRHYGLF